MSEYRGAATFVDEFSSPGSGVGSFKAGAGASALATNSIAIGNATANLFGGAGIAIGSLALVSGSNGIAIGASAQAQSTHGISIGPSTFSGQLSIAIGGLAIAQGSESVAIGQSANAQTNGQAVAIGRVASVEATRSNAIGYNARVRSSDAIAIGYFAAIGLASNNSLAIGSDSLVSHQDSIAIGKSAVSTAINRCTIGTIGGAFDSEFQVGKGIAAFGAAPPATQPVKVADPTDLTSSIAAITAIIDVLEGAGLAASV